MAKKPEEIQVIVATDCGSTTTKAILIEKQGDVYRLMYRGEAPTTVEAPFEDVTAGVLNAIEEVEELSGRKLIDDNRQIIRPSKGNVGADIYISTSSAGGGLQMMVAGVIRNMTAESAERAALGAGAIVMDAIAINDKRLPHQQIERIRKLRPDMILLSGGVEDGTISHIIEMAEIIHAANPRPRLGLSYKLPVIFAGNSKARDAVNNTLGDKVDLVITENLRPEMNRENLLPAREKIHDLFLEHVMAQAPGYKKLMSWTDAPIMPTPGAVGSIMQTIAKLENIQVVGVDIGGATTDVFSVFNEELVEGDIKPTFNRTVSANLGMSYSISNVFRETGLKNVLRWIPFSLDERSLRNQVKNKMIRPTTIPQHIDTLIFEQAIAREALRLAFVHHKSFATRLKGVQKTRDIGDWASQELDNTLVNMLELNMIIGSGGVLSHAPRRHQSALMMLDSFQPEGITRLTVDSIFMMPQLGVLADLHPQAALDVFHKDCLIYLGTTVVPSGLAKEGKDIMDYEFKYADGKVEKGTLKFGDLKLFELPLDEKVDAILKPARGFDLGMGKGKTVETKLSGGVVGLILDGRGRPLEIPEDESERVRKLKAWFKEMKVYPENAIS